MLTACTNAFTHDFDHSNLTWLATRAQGRTHAFRKKLRDVAEFVFINAPHELPLFYKPVSAEAEWRSTNQGAGCEQQQSEGQQSGSCFDSHSLPPNASRKRAWLLSPELLKYQQDQQAATQQQHEGVSQNQQQECNNSHAHWQPAPDFVAEHQHHRQTEGWDASWAVLQQAISDLGPFHGVLGFSQVRAVCFL